MFDIFLIFNFIFAKRLRTQYSRSLAHWKGKKEITVMIYIYYMFKKTNLPNDTPLLQTNNPFPIYGEPVHRDMKTQNSHCDTDTH